MIILCSPPHVYIRNIEMLNTRLMSKTDFSRQGFMNQFNFVNHRKKILRGFIVANERATCKIRVNLSHYSGNFLGITLAL